MRGFSSAYAETILQNHTAVILVQLIKNGSVVATLEVIAGSVSADRTQAQLRTIQFEIIDRDGSLKPTGMSSLLAPFGTRVQLYRGVRIQSVKTLSSIHGGSTSWTPATPTGVLNSVTTNGFGQLVLGP